MVLTSEKLEQERFTVKLIKTDEKIREVEYDTEYRTVGPFWNKKREPYQIPKDVFHDKWRWSDKCLEGIPEDMHGMILDEKPDDKGYSEYHRAGFRHYFKYVGQKVYTRNFENTLSDYFKKHNINKKDIISIEYCKDNCTLTGAYITWDKH